MLDDTDADTPTVDAGGTVCDGEEDGCAAVVAVVLTEDEVALTVLATNAGCVNESLGAADDEDVLDVPKENPPEVDDEDEENEKDEDDAEDDEAVILNRLGLVPGPFSKELLFG